MNIDPQLDLVLERIVDVQPELVWAAWTKPEHLVKWFCPAPWRTIDCTIDLRPGGVFRTVMRGPDGTEMTHLGCYLEVVSMKRLVWTDALEGGYRPNRQRQMLPFRFTATILVEPHGKGTKYTAIAMHADAESARKHDEIGFTVGWGKALDQMVDEIQRGQIR